MKIPIPGMSARAAKRLFKGVLALLICFALVLVNPVNGVMGTSSYLIVMVAVNVHPARRLGAMIEAVVLSIIGSAIGLAYALFGHFLANKVMHSHGLENALAFLAVLEVIMLFTHGFIRSYSPRLFLLVFLIFLVVHFSFLTNLGTPYPLLARSFSVPICMGIVVCLVVNLAFFPEFGSAYVGESVVDCMSDLHAYFDRATKFFIRNGTNTENVTIEALVDYKTAIRREVANCKAVLTESLFEISYAYMSPRDLKPILKKLANAVVAFNALIGACELEYILLGDEVPRKAETEEQEEEEHEFKPHREIEFADKKVLLRFLEKIRHPIETLSHATSESFDVLKQSIAFSYDIDPDNMPDIEALEQAMSQMARAIVAYDDQVASSLESVNLKEAPADAKKNDNPLEQLASFQDDDVLMPREEFFLISSFLMNLREFGNIMTQMLSDCRDMVGTRHRRQSKGLLGRGLWFSGLSSRKLFKKYLITGNAETKEADVSSLRSHLSHQQKVDSRIEAEKLAIRSKIADIIEFPQKFKPHLKFAFNFTLLLMLVSFPAFSTDMRQWYTNIRGAWVGFVAAIALESSIGATLQIFVTRTIGLTLGSAWGYATYVAGDWGKNPYVMTVMMGVGMVPAFYTMLLSPYPKAGVVCIISANIVVLSTVRPTVPGTILENFAKRCVSMLVGGVAALVVQITIFPVKAREQLVKSIIHTIQACERIEGCISQGIDHTESSAPQMTPLEVDQTIGKLWKKAKSSLQAADAFRESSKREWRMKGSFQPYEEVYREIIFVLHQILDKFQNIAFLRKHYGSAVLDDLKPYVYLYRREFYGCLTSTLRAVEEALINKTKLPQFMPSARVAHLRIINRVREVLAYETGNNSRAVSRRSSFVDLQQSANTSGLQPLTTALRKDEDEDEQPKHAKFDLYSNDDEKGPLERHSMIKQKYMSWSATSAGLEEIVEYVEELVRLAKTVVGVNRFKFGFLSRPLLVDDKELIGAYDEDDKNDDNSDGSNDRATIRDEQRMLLDEHVLRNNRKDAANDQKGPALASGSRHGNTASGQPDRTHAEVDYDADADDVPSLRDIPKKMIKRTFSISGQQPPQFDLHPMNPLNAPVARRTSQASSTSVSSSLKSSDMPNSLKRIVSRKQR